MSKGTRKYFKRSDYLRNIAWFHCSFGWRCAGRSLAALFGFGGMALLLIAHYRVDEMGQPFDVYGLAYCVFGALGVVMSFGVMLFAYVSQVAHEVMIRIDDEYYEAYGFSDGTWRSWPPPCSDTRGNPFRRTKVSPNAGEYSTRDMTTAQRMLIVIPLVVCGVTMALAVGLFLVLSLDVDNLAEQHFVRVVYLLAISMGFGLFSTCTMMVLAQRDLMRKKAQSGADAE